MDIVYDCESSSYKELLLQLEECAWVEEEERGKIILLAPYLNCDERKKIINSLMTESAQLDAEKGKS